MPTFEYKAINEVGNGISGTLEADSLEEANVMLVERGYIPSAVRARRGKGGGKWQDLNLSFGKVATSDLVLFTKQFRTMLRAGIPILSILQTMELQTDKPRIKKALAAIGDDIKGGSSLNDAMQKHPKIFSVLYSSMVRSGEASGALTDVLDRLTYILEHEDKVKKDIQAAMFYPIIVVVFLAVAFVVLLTFVIPQFAKVFLKAGVELPLPTRICIIMYEFLHNYWYLLLIGVVAFIFLLYSYFKTTQGKYVRDATLLRVPLIGPVIVKASMSRFAAIFSIMQASGVTVLETIKILSNTIGNAAISREFDAIREKLEEGRGISQPLKAAKYFPPMVIHMVAIGEESGNLDEMLREISAHYDYEVEYATKTLSDSLGPLLTVALACIVGFFATAIFLPMWDLIKTVK